MKVQSVNNEPNFGIKCINKKAWNPKVLEAFENSKLIKEIDAKYPNASAYYNKINEAEFDMVNCEDIYTTIFDILLDSGKKFYWNLSSYSKNIPDEHLINDLQTLTLEKVEKMADTKRPPIATTEIKKPNIFQRFFNKLFGNKQ